MSAVSGNLLKEFVVALRAVAITVPATTMLYDVADLLTPGTSESGRRVNRALLTLTARLLDLPTDNPEVIERRVLRNLPEIETKGSK